MTANPKQNAVNDKAIAVCNIIYRGIYPRVVYLILVFLFASCVSTPEVQKPKDYCNLKYPILLIHGVGWRDDIKHLPYWGKLPEELEKLGAKVYLSGHESMAPFETNARIIAGKIEYILKETGATKVNIIAHSKGGLDSRYTITKLNMASKVASLTTTMSPHHGSTLSDFIFEKMDTKHKERMVSRVIKIYSKVLGDKNPLPKKTGEEITTENMKIFNEIITNCPSVYYQSYTTKMKRPCDDTLFSLTYKIIRERKGDNDGMVSVSSAIWGNYRGMLENTNSPSGISHLEMQTAKGFMVGGVNLRDFYINMVYDLKEKGF